MGERQRQQVAKESIFGLTAKYIGLTGPAPDDYAKALREFPLILLDDDGQEMADFILVSDSKVVLLHAKLWGRTTVTKAPP